MEMSDEFAKRLEKIFFPYATHRVKELQAKGAAFSHYTSAENALKIISGETVWLRNARLMNDYSEIDYGHLCIEEAMNNEFMIKRLGAVLGKVDSSLTDRILHSYKEGYRQRIRETYLISLAEHGGEGDPFAELGKLSMWRAYGGSTNVCLVLNSAPFTSPSDALNAYTSPVLYCSVDQFQANFGEFVFGLEQNIEFLQLIGADLCHELCSHALHFASLSIKHLGFSEECEWRVVHTPNSSVTGRVTNRIRLDVECVGGIPQKVAKIKLEDYPEEGFLGATIPSLLQKIIIGPTDCGYQIYEALVEVLKSKGVPDAERKVVISGIPLRR